MVLVKATIQNKVNSSSALSFNGLDFNLLNKLIRDFLSLFTLSPYIQHY